MPRMQFGGVTAFSTMLLFICSQDKSYILLMDYVTTNNLSCHNFDDSFISVLSSHSISTSSVCISQTSNTHSKKIELNYLCWKLFKLPGLIPLSH